MDNKRDYYRAVGQRVRQARDSVHLTAEQLGRSLRPEVGHAAITRWETGERRVPLDRLEQIAAVTGHAIDHFLGGPRDASESDLDRELRATFDAMRYTGPDDKRRLIEIMRALRRVQLGR